MSNSKGSLVCVFAFFLAFASYGNAPDKGRISEIAATLSDEPGFPHVRASNRALWDRVASMPGADKIVSSADGITSAPIPVVDDRKYEKFTQWEHPSLARRKNMQKLLFAECIENKGRFIPRITEYLDAISSQTTWVNPYHDRKFGNVKGLYRSIDLSCGMGAVAVAITLDTLDGKLPKKTVERAMLSIREKVFDIYLGVCDNPSEFQKRRCPWFFGNANWNAACHAYVLSAALRIVRDRTERARFIEGAERGYPRYFNSFTSDGFCTEGPSYWNYGFGQFVRLGLVVRLATNGKVDFFSHPKARVAMDYAYGFQMAEGVVAQIGDGLASPSPMVISMAELIWPDVRTTYSSKVPWNAGGIEVFQLRAAYGDILAKKEPPPTMKLPVRTFFSEAQVLVCRQNGESSSSLAASIKGSHNGVSHNHNDVGVYEIVLDGVRMVHDPGNQKYDRDTFGPKRYESVIRNSYGHNVPVPAGELQKTGKNYGARLVSTDFSDEYDTIILDIKDAYAVKGLKRLDRRMTFSRRDSFVEIEDSVTFLTPSSFETPVTTYGDIVEGEKPGEFLVVKKHKGVEKRLRFTVDAGNTKWHVKKESHVNGKYGRLIRFAVVLDEPVSAASVKLRFME